jgi:DNA polymerase-1
MDDVSEAPRRLFLLDGHSLAYRAFFALPQTLATSSGTVTNAVYGFTTMLIKLFGDEHPDLIAVAFDMGAPTVRLEMDAAYKAGRAETPTDFRPQLGLIEEVLDVLRIPVIRMAGHEADDAIGTLAVEASDEGIDTVIVTADRDFFQLVRDRAEGHGAIGVLFNRRGISEIEMMGPEQVEARYGITPAQYLDFVALKGDTSDNIPGVPGVGDKTAAKLINEFGSVDELLAHTDRLKGKQRENIEAAADRLALNKQLARIVTDLELDVRPEDCEMGASDPEQIRSLFVSLEFRSLLDRLAEALGTAKPMAEIAALDLQRVEPAELVEALGAGSTSVIVRTDEGGIRGAAVSAGGAQASYADIAEDAPLLDRLGDADLAKQTHDAKALGRTVTSAGGALEGVSFDTLVGGYLLDPGTTAYSLDKLTERYLGTDLLAGLDDDDDAGQLFADDPWRRTAAEAAAVGLLAPVMEEQIDKHGLRSLLMDVELPLSSVLGRMEARGVRLDTAYLDELGEGVRDRMATLKAEIYAIAGREFNLNSPPQLREVLYGELGLQPGKKTPKGELSTDASVLEKLRDEHPIVDALLSWRELDKLNSTYLEALPKLADDGGRVHTTYNQAAAATGRLSSTNPNLQNIPIRSEVGRQIRRSFIPGGDDQVLLVADYSQIELRVLAHLSGDEGLLEAFAAGSDIHAATAAKVFDLPIQHVDGELRRRAKAVNFGLAYGMNAWGLSQRLDIAPDEAQEIIDGYFDGFPKIKTYLAAQVERARLDGYTETLLGRRRYIPELTSDNRRLRELGERQALNAPIQGGASDVFKLAMIKVDRALHDAPELDCHMLLTVHDELVFEVPKDHLQEASELVRQGMEHAIDLDVPLVASIASGPNWADAAPEGH